MAASVRALCGYFPSLQESSTLTLRQEQNLLYLEYRINDGRIVCRRQDAELTLGVLCNVFWHCFGQRWCPLEVHFEHPAPRTGSEQSKLLQAPIYFSQPSNALVFRRGDLNAVMHSADPYLLSLLEPLLQERQRKVRSDDLVGMVCRGIERRFSGGEPSLSQVAHDLGMSRRILQRNLQERAVAYSDLVRGVRRDLATRYLAEPHIPLTEIAFMLGYSELSAFSRAFRQWTGLPPRRYRNQSAEMQRGTKAGSQPADHPKAWSLISAEI